MVSQTTRLVMSSDALILSHGMTAGSLMCLVFASPTDWHARLVAIWGILLAILIVLSRLTAAVLVIVARMPEPTEITVTPQLSCGCDCDATPSKGPDDRV